jgi:hypothetical protein
MKKDVGRPCVCQKVLDLSNRKCECVNWINLAQQREQCQTLANIAMNDLKFLLFMGCGSL